jgi:hypothetical protein
VSTHSLRVFTAALIGLALAPSAAHAQDISGWGSIVSVTPQWQVPTQLEQLFDGTVGVSGTDFSIGIARGRASSGDWGVSYVRKHVNDGSHVDDLSTDCGSFTNGCFVSGEAVFTRGVSLNGVEVHKFVPFATFARRVQIGMNFAGGIGAFRGTLEKHSFSSDTAAFDPRTGRPSGKQNETVTNEPASELISLSVVPLAKVQLAVSGIITPAIKIRVQGGLDLPGYEFVSVVAAVFFGGK